MTRGTTTGYTYDAAERMTKADSTTYSCDAFGNVRARTGTSTQPYQYVGNAYDSTTKLYDFHARAYDQSMRRSPYSPRRAE